MTQLQIAAKPFGPTLPPGEYKLQVGWTCEGDSAFFQVTSVFVGLQTMCGLVYITGLFMSVFIVRITIVIE